MSKKIWDYQYMMGAALLASIVTIAVSFFTGLGDPGAALFSIVLITSFGVIIFGATVIGMHWPKWKKSWYTLNVIPFVIMLFAIYDYNTCSGKFCQLNGMIFGAGSIFALIVMWLSYASARFGERYKVMRVIFFVVCLFTAMSALYLTGQSILN